MQYMEPEQLRRWLDEGGLSVTDLARELDVDRSTIHRYLSGETRIPRTVELALEALAAKK